MASTPNPVVEGHRVAALDTLRGMAVFGILLVNVNQLFEPIWIANSPLGLVRDQSFAGVLWFLSDALISDKFLALFSLLFGAGFALQWSRTADDDRQFREIYRRRLAWLALFGLLHALFLYFADVLFIYAMAGALLLLMRRWPGRRLLVAGIGLWTLTLLWQAVLHGGSDEPRSLADQHRELIEMVDRLDLTRGNGDRAGAMTLERAIEIVTSGSELEKALLEHRAFADGPMELTLLQRASFFALLLLYAVLYLVWRTLAIFLMAAGLVKLGMLEARRRTEWRKAVWLGTALGLPMTLLATWLRRIDYWTVSGSPWIGSTLHELSSLLLAGAIAAATLIWCSTMRAASLQQAFATVGRTALTNYIGQSAIVSLMACWYGLGLYGELTRAQQLALACMLFVVQVALSRLWLSRFSMGPLEWIWRRLTYRRPLELRRAATD